jgi:hypothetical protein
VQIVAADEGDQKVTEQELLFHLTLLEPGLWSRNKPYGNNADLILEHLREHGYFKAEVTLNRNRCRPRTTLPWYSGRAKSTCYGSDLRYSDRRRRQRLFADSLKLKPGKVFTRELLDRREKRSASC